MLASFNATPINIAIINRSSVVAGAPVSRSVVERLVEPIAFLERQGILNYAIFSEASWSSIDFTKFTHILLNRPHSKFSLNLLFEAKKYRCRVICDLDDIPIYFPVTDRAYLDPEKKLLFYEILSNSDFITCSTSPIQIWVKNNIHSKENIIIKTGYDFKRIESLTLHNNFKPDTVLFTNAGSLKLGVFKNDWLKAMKDILVKRNWRLGVFADTSEDFSKDFPLEYYGSVPWMEHKTIINKSFPFSVVPLAGDEDKTHLMYSQYKTPVKYFINGGLGIPCIYSKSPIYENVINNFENGILVKNDLDSWKEALELMISNNNLRNSIARKAFIDVRENFDIVETSRQWLQLLNSI